MILFKVNVMQGEGKGRSICVLKNKQKATVLKFTVI